MRPWPVLAVFAMMATITAAQVSYVVWGWQDDWPPGAQATVAGAIIMFDGAVFSAALKWLFDTITLRTTHQLNVRKSVLDDFHKYAANYIVPLAASSGHLASYLSQWVAAEESNAGVAERERHKAEAAERVFYYLAQYSKFQAAVSARFVIPGVDPPLGIFLESRAAERRVWDWMLPLWALNLRNLNDESTLIQGLTGSDGKPRSRMEFIAATREQGSDLNRLFTSIVGWLQDGDYLKRVINVLAAFNLLLDYEVQRVYAVWYSDEPVEPRDAVAAIDKLSPDSRNALGLFHRPRFFDVS